MPALFRYAGSKLQTCPTMFEVMLQRLPQPKRYLTPTLGSGADLYHAVGTGLFEEYIASDINQSIVAAHEATKAQSEELITRLKGYAQVSEASNREWYEYYKKRGTCSEFDRQFNQLADAIRTLFLIGCSFNGLWRESKKSGFNVPFGKRFSFQPEKILECSRLLNLIPGSLAVCDFEQTLSQARPGDLVYIDPPFCGSSATFGGKWKEADHRRLMRCAEQAKAQGATVFISNADHPDTYAFYRGTFHKIQVQRTVAAKSTSRKLIEELLIEV